MIVFQPSDVIIRHARHLCARIDARNDHCTWCWLARKFSCSSRVNQCACTSQVPSVRFTGTCLLVKSGYCGFNWISHVCNHKRGCGGVRIQLKFEWRTVISGWLRRNWVGLSATSRSCVWRGTPYVRCFARICEISPETAVKATLWHALGGWRKKRC